MNKKVIQLYERSDASFNLRSLYKIPVVLYGFNIKKSMSLCVDGDIKNTFNKLGKFVYSTLFEVNIKDQKYTCIIKDIATHPITEDIIHLDFQSVGENNKFMMYCPINIVNKDKCEALKSKAAMFIPQPIVKIRCSLSNFISSIDIDIANFAKGQNLQTKHISNIEFVGSGLLFAIR